jgi:hypothetical protein
MPAHQFGNQSKTFKGFINQSLVFDIAAERPWCLCETIGITQLAPCVIVFPHLKPKDHTPPHHRKRPLDPRTPHSYFLP